MEPMYRDRFDYLDFIEDGNGEDNEIQTKQTYHHNENNEREPGSFLYRDEPIPPQDPSYNSKMPEQYDRMKKLFGGKIYFPFRGNADIFVMQAKFMENFEDDYSYAVGFNQYYPTYAAMTDAQLRTYFSWRTKVRHGQVTKTSLSYVFVYIYELLNLVGARDAEDAFQKLISILEEYKKFDRIIECYIHMWLPDFVAYYQLNSSYLEQFPHSLPVIRRLFHMNETPNDELFFEIEKISSYKIQESRFYPGHEKEIYFVVATVLRNLNSYYQTNFNQNFCEVFCGKWRHSHHSMFTGAVFYPQKRDKNYEYPIHEEKIFQYQDGEWIIKDFILDKRKHTEIGELLKEIERLLREDCGFRYALKKESLSDEIERFIVDAINRLHAEKKKIAIQKISIDKNQLDSIRSFSNQTMNRLIVDVEEEEPPKQKIQSKEILKQESPLFSSLTNSDEIHFNANEREILRAFLEGGSPKEIAKKQGSMLSVLIDSINEKLFEQFGDSVILYDGDEPELIEDYIPELKELLSK